MNAVQHVADADDVRLPFDWTEHEESAECWCEPELDETLTSKNDAALRDRILDKYGRWGAFSSEVVESSGDALDDCARALGMERERVTTVVHRRPIEYGIDGVARVVARW